MTHPTLPLWSGLQKVYQRYPAALRLQSERAEDARDRFCVGSATAEVHTTRDLKLTAQ